MIYGASFWTARSKARGSYVGLLTTKVQREFVVYGLCAAVQQAVLQSK